MTEEAPSQSQRKCDLWKGGAAELLALTQRGDFHVTKPKLMRQFLPS